MKDIKKGVFLKKIFWGKKFFKDTGTSDFKETIFLVRGDDSPTRHSEGDMIYEANRIIAESLNQSDAVSKGERCGLSLKFLATFFLGAIFSAALFLTFKFIFD